MNKIIAMLIGLSLPLQAQMPGFLHRLGIGGTSTSCEIYIHNSSYSLGHKGHNHVHPRFIYLDASGELVLFEPEKGIGRGHSETYTVGDETFCPSKVVITFTDDCSTIEPQRVTALSPGQTLSVEMSQCGCDS